MNVTTLFYCADWLGKSSGTNQHIFLLMVCVDTDHEAGKNYQAIPILRLNFSTNTYITGTTTSVKKVAKANP